MPAAARRADPLPRWAAAVPVVLAAWLALANATTAPWAMNPDGVAYLDQAEAWRTGDLAHAVNSYWSPGYPLLLAAWQSVAEPLGLPRVPAVHLLHVLVAASFAAAAMLLHRRVDAALAADGVAPWGRWLAWLSVTVGALVVVGVLTPASLLTPDLLQGALLLLTAAAALDRVEAGTESAWGWWRLGGLVGLLYLVKTPGLPIGAVVVLGAAVAMPGVGVRRMGRRLAWATGGAALLVVPWAAALTHADGRLTLGSSATLSRSWSWNGGVLSAIHGGWAPRVRAVPADAYGTFPLWYAPQRHIGPAVPSRAATRDLGSVVRQNLMRWPARRTHGAMAGLVGLTLLAVIAGAPAVARRRAAVLVMPVLAGTAMYLLVHTEERFHAGLLVLAIAGAASSVASVPGRDGRWLALLLLVMLAVMVRPLREAPLVPRTTRPPDASAGALAALAQAGIGAGASVAVVGEPFGAMWLQTARVRVAASVELREVGAWETLPSAQRAAWTAAFRAAGAEAIVVTHGRHDATVLPLRPEPAP